MLLVKYLGE